MQGRTGGRTPARRDRAAEATTARTRLVIRHGRPVVGTRKPARERHDADRLGDIADDPVSSASRSAKCGIWRAPQKTGDGANPDPTAASKEADGGERSEVLVRCPVAVGGVGDRAGAARSLAAVSWVAVRRATCADVSGSIDYATRELDAIRTAQRACTGRPRGVGALEEASRWPSSSAPLSPCTRPACGRDREGDAVADTSGTHGDAGVARSASRWVRITSSAA